MKEVFTVGHSNHPIEGFISLLNMHHVSAVADVRSSPYSQYSPQFNMEPLREKLSVADIEYVFLGRELGARRTEESCYVDGQAKYDLIRTLPLFRKGLERLIQGIHRYRLALMCSEKEPLACHRTTLVCRELKQLYPELNVKHILGDGSIETHEDAEERLIKMHKLQPELFGDLTSLSGLIEKAYDMQAERVAHIKVTDEV